MGTDENKMLVRRQFDDIWNGANWASVDQLFARDYVNHDPYNPDQPTGPQGFRQRVEGYRSVLDNFDLRVEQQIAEGDMVETHWSLRGIHAGPLEGVDPTVANRSTWRGSCSAGSLTASLSRSGCTGTPSVCSARSGRCLAQRLDRGRPGAAMDGSARAAACPTSLDL